MISFLKMRNHVSTNTLKEVLTLPLKIGRIVMEHKRRKNNGLRTSFSTSDRAIAALARSWS